MEVSVAASPRKSMAEKVFGGYHNGSTSQKKRGTDARHDDSDGGLELMEIGAERTKSVLILMSDTGGGHRASAEAIRDAFQIEFGDEYRVILLLLASFVRFSKKQIMLHWFLFNFFLTYFICFSCFEICSALEFSGMRFFFFVFFVRTFFFFFNLEFNMNISYS